MDRVNIIRAKAPRFAPGSGSPDAQDNTITGSLSVSLEEAERDGGQRMEDEGGPALPEESRRERSPTQRLQRLNRRPAHRRAYKSPTVADVMTKSARPVHPENSIKEAALALAADAAGVLAVVDSDNRLLGSISDRDIVFRVCAGDKSVEGLRVADAMRRDPAAVGPAQSVKDAVDAMAKARVQSIPVVNEARQWQGMVSLGDIASRCDAGIDIRAALAAVADRSFLLDTRWK